MLILEVQTLGKLVKETVKELGGELVKLGVTTLAEAALESVIEDEKDCDDEDGWWWFKGIRIKLKQ